MCDCMLLSFLLGELYRLEPVAENRFCGLLVSAKETPSLQALALDLKHKLLNSKSVNFQVSGSSSRPCGPRYVCFVELGVRGVTIMQIAVLSHISGFLVVRLGLQFPNFCLGGETVYLSSTIQDAWLQRPEAEHHMGSSRN